LLFEGWLLRTERTGTENGQEDLIEELLQTMLAASCLMMLLLKLLVSRTAATKLAITCSSIILTLPASMGGSARREMAGDADPLPLAAGTTMDHADLQLQQKINAFVQASVHNSKNQRPNLQNGDATAADNDGRDDENGETDESNAITSIAAPSFFV
jgi:hypothetical protein